MSDEFSKWFKGVACVDALHPWQARMGESKVCDDRVIRIPTGFGKTAGTVLPWLFNRVVRGGGDRAWPTRLVFCLPMRTLVEQTQKEAKNWLERAQLSEMVGLHVLMGGSDAGSWRQWPEKPAILIGTQEMLLSRALNRGYGVGRGAWPMEFGLLHHDALWVCDEIQLQDVGLATTAQLAAFRARATAPERPSLRPTATWWMSATLQPEWLETVDHKTRVMDLVAKMEHIPESERRGELWNVRKSLRRIFNEDGLAEPESLARVAGESHGRGSLTLVILNTVKRAVEVFAELEKRFRSKGKASRKAGLPLEVPDLKLIHSRFRGAERRAWADQFLSRRASLPEAGRIIVCTQVVEAGVDISARLLITDLAPWPSLVQRFGRAARYAGEKGEILVAGSVPSAQQAAPYELECLSAADDAVRRLEKNQEGDASPTSLEQFEASLAAEERRALYPYVPLHVLRRRDLEQLFDTSVDLSGADVDVSRFIRTGEDRDVLVFWRERSSKDERIPQPQKDELCTVPINELKDWLGKKKDRHALRFDYLEGEWLPIDKTRVAPGAVVLLSAEQGGYSPIRGWSPEDEEPVGPVPHAPDTKSDEILEREGDSEDDDALASAGEWRTIAEHGADVCEELLQIAQELMVEGPLKNALAHAARVHDIGKRLEAFQSNIKKEKRDEVGGLALSRELAKAPDVVWVKPSDRERRGYRHELVSTLALFELLRRADCQHPALLGAHRELFKAIEPFGARTREVPIEKRIDRREPLVRELLELTAEQIDLIAWLVCTHHGKVRCAWMSTPRDQETGDNRIHGVLEAEQLPSVEVATASGERARIPELDLTLELASMGIGERYGASWGERVCGLLERHGPFELAFLEALLRAADIRASAQPNRHKKGIGR